MIKNEEKKYIYLDVVISWFPFFVCFIVIPLAIYIPNQIEFGHKLLTVAPLFICGAISFVALMGLRYLPPGLRSKLAKGLFFLGAFLLLSDILAPLQWGIFDGEETLEEPFRLTIIESVVAVGIVMCYFVLPMNQVRGFGATIVIALFAVQMVYLASGISSGNSTRQPVEIIRKIELGSPPASKRGNVYHLVFDAYSSRVFVDSLRQLGLSKEFEGFTFFENNLSNYLVTDASTPSFLSGNFYEGGSFKAWQIEASNGGLRKRLQQAGYEVSVYVPNRSRSWMFDDATQTRTSRDLAKIYLRGGDEILLAQISLVRVTPNFLRKEVYTKSYKAYTKILNMLNKDGPPLNDYWDDYRHYKSLSVPLFEQFLQEEIERSPSDNYIYLHVILPHPPFKWSANCSYSNANPTNFTQQTYCSMLLMAKLIRTLKKLHRFESSTIVIQSDHGYHGEDVGEAKTGLQASNDVVEKIASTAKYFTPDGVFRRLHSLLVIKPPFAASKPLVVSQAPTQLVDIPATIYAALNMKAPKGKGTSVFDLSESEAREIEFFAGFYNRDSTGKVVTLGKNMSAGNLAHISYEAGRGWLIYDDIASTYE